MDTVSKAQTFRNGLRCFMEKRLHVAAGFQVPLGIGLQQPPRTIQRHMCANAGHNILQLPPLGTMIQHIIMGEQRHPNIMRHPLPLSQMALVIAMVQHGHTKPEAIWGEGFECGEKRRERDLIRPLGTFSNARGRWRRDDM